jgi:hypothetical protein
MDAKVQPAWERLCDRWDTEGYDSLSRPEQAWLNLRGLIDSVENGGMISYFYNTGADTFADCLEDLQTVGATEIRAEVERVSGLFPAGVPVTVDQRNAVIDAWPDGSVDDLLESVDTALEPLLPDLEARLASLVDEHRLAT